MKIHLSKVNGGGEYTSFHFLNLTNETSNIIKEEPYWNGIHEANQKIQIPLNFLKIYFNMKFFFLAKFPFS